MDRVAIKEQAKSMIKGNKWKIWQPFLIIMVASSVLSGIVGSIDGNIGAILSFLVSVVSTIFSTAATAYVIKFVRGENPELNDVVECVKQRWLPIFLTSLLIGIFVVLWSILFIIPGIIAALSYSMAYYIVVDSDLDAMGCIKKSKEMMNGHKWEFFVFGLSFMGWTILATLTFGILYIWLFPYMLVAYTLYYENLSGNKVQEVIKSAAEPVAEPNPIQE